MTGRVAIVTGGGTGIGRSTAHLLAERGADVVLAGRRPEPLERTAEEIRALGRAAMPVPTDVSDPAQCQALVDATMAKLGRLDVLVNSAGGADTKPILKWTEDEFRQVMALNFDSVWFLSRCAVQPMITQGKGTIVNISSGASLLAMPQAAVYAAAKAAVNNVTGSMAATWTRKGVRVNSIAVGAVAAATLLDDLARIGMDPEVVAKTNASQRLGDPEEIAHAVLFFASDASSFCSGQTLYVHGGPGPAGI
jgi:NAD(P)-dependent dehydrogenase (short-subunit alcohol dehydrogenase family)